MKGGKIYKVHQTLLRGRADMEAPLMSIKDEWIRKPAEKAQWEYTAKKKKHELVQKEVAVESISVNTESR